MSNLYRNLVVLLTSSFLVAACSAASTNENDGSEDALDESSADVSTGRKKEVLACCPGASLNWKPLSVAKGAEAEAFCNGASDAPPLKAPKGFKPGNCAGEDNAKGANKWWGCKPKCKCIATCREQGVTFCCAEICTGC